MVRLCLMLILIFSPSVSWGFTSNVTGDVHGIGFVGTANSISPNPVISMFIPEFCNDGEDYTKLRIRIQQAEATPGQVGMVLYRVPGWVRFPTESTAIICIGFTNLKITLKKVGDMYVQDAETENETLSKVRVYPQ